MEVLLTLGIGIALLAGVLAGNIIGYTIIHFLDKWFF